VSEKCFLLNKQCPLSILLRRICVLRIIKVTNIFVPSHINFATYKKIYTEWKENIDSTGLELDRNTFCKRVFLL